MTPSTSAKSYSAAERDYARLELHQNAYAAAIRKLGERPKGKLSEDEIAQIESSLPPVSEAAVDTWLAQYGRPIQPVRTSLAIPPQVYQKRTGYGTVGKVLGAVVFAAVGYCNNSPAHARVSETPQIVAPLVSSETVNNTIGGASVAALGLVIGGASGRLGKQTPDRKSFWAAYKS